MKAEAQALPAPKKEEDPESLLMKLISMPSGSSPSFLLSLSSYRERMRRRRLWDVLRAECRVLHFMVPLYFYQLLFPSINYFIHPPLVCVCVLVCYKWA